MFGVVIIGTEDQRQIQNSVNIVEKSLLRAKLKDQNVFVPVVFALTRVATPFAAYLLLRKRVPFVGHRLNVTTYP